MEFRDFIYHVSPLLQNAGFRVTESSQGFELFEKKGMVIALAYDPRDRSYYVSAGVNKDQRDELHYSSLKDVFGFDMGDVHPAEAFLRFFQQKENPLLNGDSVILEKLRQYSNQRAVEYMRNLLEQQHLDDANAAWKRKDYRTFINSIDKINSSRLLESYKIKQRIALSKTGNR